VNVSFTDVIAKEGFQDIFYSFAVVRNPLSMTMMMTIKIVFSLTKNMFFMKCKEKFLLDSPFFCWIVGNENISVFIQASLNELDGKNSMKRN
jgi:hypothetical protein